MNKIKVGRNTFVNKRYEKFETKPRHQVFKHEKARNVASVLGHENIAQESGDTWT